MYARFSLRTPTRLYRYAPLREEVETCFIRKNTQNSKNMLKSIIFHSNNLQITEKAVPLHCVFHSIRFKVNKGWSKALLLFLCPYPKYTHFPLLNIPEKNERPQLCQLKSPDYLIYNLEFLFFCITFDGLSTVRTYRDNLDRSFQLFFQESNISVEFFWEFVFAGHLGHVSLPTR